MAVISCQRPVTTTRHANTGFAFKESRSGGRRNRTPNNADAAIENRTPLVVPGRRCSLPLIVLPCGAGKLVGPGALA